VPDSASKRCTKCGETKPLSKFYRNRNTPDGMHSWCRSCRHPGIEERYHARRVEAAELAPLGLRRCTACGEVQAVSEFGRDAGNRDGLHLNCKLCRAEERKRLREKNPEKYRAAARAGSARYRDREGNRERIRAEDRQRYAANREEHKARKSRYAANLRAVVFAHYGQACACCGTTDRLSMDHINGDGKQHRREQRLGGMRIYTWLIREGFPPGFQVLCMSCNLSKGRGASCCLDHGQERV
jgi:hypothetical protein